MNLNGVTIKDVVFHKDHEGAPIASGEICYQGQSVGRFQDSFWGGTMDCRFRSKKLQKVVETQVEAGLHRLGLSSIPKEIQAEFVRDANPPVDCFVNHAIELLDIEKYLAQIEKKRANVGMLIQVKLNILDFGDRKLCYYEVDHKAQNVCINIDKMKKADSLALQKEIAQAYKEKGTYGMGFILSKGELTPLEKFDHIRNVDCSR